MGYGACVACNCYKEGLATEPPHKPYVYIDPEDGSVGINTAHLKDKEEQLKWWLEFDEWRMTACPHEDMMYAYERLANMSGMAAFRGLVAEFGGNARFPVLTEHLPIGNGGTLPVEFTPVAYYEVLTLKQEKLEQKLVVLQEAESGDIIASTSVNHDNTFVFSAAVCNYVISADGFSIIKLKRHFWETNKTDFKSIHFKQHRIDDNQFEFEDLTTGNKSIQHVKLYPIDSLATQDYSFVVSIQQASISTEYAYIIEPLINVLKASSETENPVCWL
ncbi:hypothetical protein GCM10028822_29260 [Hymenobacter terrigena]